MISGGHATLVRMGVLAVLWGSGFLWIKLALTGLTPIQITVIRCALGTAVLLVIARSSGNGSPATGAPGVISSWPRSSATRCRSPCSASASRPSAPGSPSPFPPPSSAPRRA
ncbi:hypothetical protein QMK34_41945 [Amycolatopsis sp. H20-H5]|nr:hypothetical protein [Amycolatopsis sp. H20-H5]